MRTINEICELFRVGRKTVQSWIDTGQLATIDVSPAGSKRSTFRIPQESLEVFRARRSGSVGVSVTGKPQAKKSQPAKEILK